MISDTRADVKAGSIFADLLHKTSTRTAGTPDFISMATYVHTKQQCYRMSTALLRRPRIQWPWDCSMQAGQYLACVGSRNHTTSSVHMYVPKVPMES